MIDLNKLYDNTYKYMQEVFVELGVKVNFHELIFHKVNALFPGKEISILDVGCRYGETLGKFLNAGYQNLEGMDINIAYLRVAEQMLGDQIVWMKGNALNIEALYFRGQFDVIVSSRTIHNLTILEREKFFEKLCTLRPKFFVLLDKIVNLIPKLHDQEIVNYKAAIRKVYYSYGLDELAEEWVKHSDVDDDGDHRMTIQEIQQNLRSTFSLEIKPERYGIMQMVLCRLKQ